MPWYREQAPPPGLDDVLACTWGADVGGPPRALVPDGCIDVVWTSAGGLVVCGPETRGWTFAFPPGTTAVGARFLPGAGPTVLGLDAGEVAEQRVDVAAVWGDRSARQLADRLGSAPSAPARHQVLLDLVARRRADAPAVDPVIREVAARAAAGDRLSVRVLAAEAGLSERQLHRRATSAFGYGPSVLARILRLQRFLAVARQADGGRLAELAAVAGYADQPHLNRDVRSLAGTTPTALLAA